MCAGLTEGSNRRGLIGVGVDLRSLPSYKVRCPSTNLARVAAMDYDRYDATLHWIFKQTQGDAWFRPNEDALPPGVCLRTHDGSFRVFPYEVAALEPFEAAVAALNPLVAVKVRSAAVHAALAECANDDKPDGVYVDADTRIQIIDTMVLLPQADKEQNAAFIVRALPRIPFHPQLSLSPAR